MDKINIGIDGPASTGKDTITKILFYALNHLPLEGAPVWKVIDSSSMYRAIVLFLERNCERLEIKPMSALDRSNPMDSLNPADLERIIDFTKHLHLDLDFLAGVKCSYQKEETDIGNYFSHKGLQDVDIGTYAGMLGRVGPVRPLIVEMEREYAKNSYCIIPGRDSFTVVLRNIPGAKPIGIYAFAEVETRAKRRHEEVLAKGGKSSYEQILRAIEERDVLDFGRKEAPLPPNPEYAIAAGYSVVDSTKLSLYEMGLCAVNIVLPEMRLDLEKQRVESLVKAACAFYDIK